jgi:hypothetical protein
LKLFLAAACALAAAVWPGVSHSAVDGARRAEEDRAPEESEHRSARERGWKPFWIDGGAGYELVNLTTFSANQNLTAELVPSKMGGFGGHLGLGFRLFTLTLGARASVANLENRSPSSTAGDLQLWSLDAEATFRLFSGRIEPYFLLAAGYTTVGGLRDALRGVRQGLDMDGANARAGLGLSLQPSQVFSLDARLTGELLFLARPGVPVRDLAEPQRVGTLNEAKARVLEGNGSSVGTAVALMVGPGFHF